MLVFSPEVDPEMEIVQWIADFLTFRDGAKKFSLFEAEDIVEPTDVTQSFLIKLFLQCSKSNVSAYMNDLIERWDVTGNELSQLPKMVMVMNCHKVRRLSSLLSRGESVQFTPTIIEMLVCSIGFTMDGLKSML